MNEPRDLRIVPIPDGWATALETRRVGGPWISILVISVLIVPLFAALFLGVHNLGAVSLVAVLTLAALSAAVTPNRRSLRIEARQHGIHVGYLFTKGPPDAEEVRANQATQWLWSPSMPEHRIPFDTLNGLGHTDVSIWFSQANEKIELKLENTRRSDIARLASEIQQLWERHRAGVRVDELEARTQREKLGVLQAWSCRQS